MTATQVHGGMGAVWQQRMDSLREYEIVRDGNAFGAGFSSSVVFTSEYDDAYRQLGHLLKKYEGIPFAHVFPGTEVTNDGGVCYCMQSECDLPAIRFDAGRFRSDVLSDLTLIRGIGTRTQHVLKRHGYETLDDLTRHPRFRTAAGAALEHLSRGTSRELMEFIGSRHRKSHPFILGTAGLHEPEDYVFIDIETLGLFSRPITLFGVGTIAGGRLRVRQYLLRDIPEEEAALVAVTGHLSGDNPALVTFNGKSFDLPYILDRMAYYGLPATPRLPHYDALHFSRQRWKDRFSSFRLSVLERELLGVHREDDIPGAMVPEFYETYLRTGNCGPLVPVVEHNRQDVVSLARIFFHLLGESYGC